jgi:hypothetical protein
VRRAPNVHGLPLLTRVVLHVHRFTFRSVAGDLGRPDGTVHQSRTLFFLFCGIGFAFLFLFDWVGNVGSGIPQSKARKVSIACIAGIVNIARFCIRK